MKAVKLLIRYSNAVCQEYFIVYFKCSLGIIIIAIDIAIYVSTSTFQSKTSWVNAESVFLHFSAF